MERFSPIEGLRGYLALWVAIGHALQLGGIVSGSGLLQIILDGGAAVRVFIIISGFVITHLLVSRQDPYVPYVVRRFFRLFPAFVLTCAVGYLLAGYYAVYVEQVPWSGEAFWTAVRESRVERFNQLRDNLFPHLVAHATMLHGAIPGELLPEAGKTFNAPAWSISLEWQFYLVAPLVLASLRSPIWTSLMLGAALVAYALFSKGLLGFYDDISTLAGATAYFGVGIMSRLAFAFLQRQKVAAAAAAIGAVFVAASIVSDKIPFVIWGVFYAYLVWGGAGAGKDSAFYRFAFTNAPSLYLGKISYSVYLAHMLLMEFAGYLALKLVPGITQAALLAILLGTVVVTVPIAALLYRFVEQPGIALGTRLARLTKAGSRST